MTQASAPLYRCGAEAERGRIIASQAVGLQSPVLNTAPHGLLDPNSGCLGGGHGRGHGAEYRLWVGLTRSPAASPPMARGQLLDLPETQRVPLWSGHLGRHPSADAERNRVTCAKRLSDSVPAKPQLFWTGPVTLCPCRPAHPHSASRPC